MNSVGCIFEEFPSMVILDCLITLLNHELTFNYALENCRTWENTAPWTGAQVKVPAKFVVGELDLAYHMLGVKDYIQSGGFQKDVPLLQEVVVMEDTAHFINEEKPDEINKHIYEFIKQF